MDYRTWFWRIVFALAFGGFYYWMYRSHTKRQAAQTLLRDRVAMLTDMLRVVEVFGGGGITYGDRSAFRLEVGDTSSDEALIRARCELMKAVLREVAK